MLDVGSGAVGTRIWPADLCHSPSASLIKVPSRVNKWEYRDGVLAFATIPDQEAVALLIPDVEAWAELLKKHATVQRTQARQGTQLRWHRADCSAHASSRPLSNSKPQSGGY